MRKLYLFVLIFTLSIIQSKSQETSWLTFLGGPGPQFATDIRQTSDGGYIISGYASEGFGGTYYLIRLDNSGNILWEKNINKDNYTERAFSVIETPDSNYLVIGTATMLNRPWLVKLDQVGDTLWTTTWTDSLPQNSAVLARGTLLADGRIVVIGAEGQLGLQPNMFIVNQEGDLLESRTLIAPIPPGFYSGTIVNHIEPTNDGGFILTGTAGGGSAAKAFLWKFDLNADSSWAVVYQDPIFGMRSASSVKQLADGGYILAGSSSPNTEHTSLIRTDSTGIVIWAQTFPDNVYTQATDVIEWNDGVLVVTEKRFEAVGETIFETGLLKIDSDGNLMNRDIITAPSSSVAIYRMRNTTDGGFVMAGEINEMGILNEQDLFVLKSDPYGDISNSFFEIIVGLPDNQSDLIENQQVTFSPNPVKPGMKLIVSMSVPIHDLKIINLNGQIIEQQTVTGKDSFEVQAPATPGLYLFIVRLESGKTAVAKLIVR